MIPASACRPYIVISTRQLFWAPDNEEFSADLTDIPEFRPGLPEEFILKSARTGNEVRVRYVKGLYDTEGGRIGWRYRPLTGHNWTLVIYND